ncbi:CorA family divalent cation transporter [Cellulomonas cellasea]|uniref:Magnesium transporter n=1 Tax=Cellulomonas cellasea TaxID=43670 RepID=A0A7W4UDC4_9CELL|nr:CorA family divalent cation transporter [Cellulomonas cellasea]MBB2922107.1 magnesium transporter [Cellulomonas cellasea]
MDTLWVRTAEGWSRSDEHQDRGDPALGRGRAADDVEPGPGAGERWVRVDGLEELAAAARRWGAPPGVVGVVRSTHGLWTRRAHVEHLPDGGLLLAAPTLAYDPATLAVTSGRVVCLVAGTLAVTAETPEGHTLDAVEDRLRSGAAAPATGAWQVLAALLGSLVTRAAAVETALGEAVAETEAVVFARTRSHPLERVYGLKREIAEARRALVPFSAELSELAPDAGDEADGTAWAWLRRLEAAVERVDRRLDAHDALLGDLLSVHLAQVTLRQNEDQRRISAWAAIGALPTLVASVYGMNFQHMPELAWTYGYGLVLVVLATSCTVLYRRFRRSGWL